MTKSIKNKITNDVHNTNHFAIEDYYDLIGLKKNCKIFISKTFITKFGLF